MRYFLIFTLTLSLWSAAYAEDLVNSIRLFDFKQFLIQRNQLEKSLRLEFPEDLCPDLIKRIDVHYGKLIGKSTEQAVVEAVTCAMGNGGADIVEVFDLSGSGIPIRLMIDDSSYDTNKLYQGQHWTPRLEILNDRLTRWFVMYDKSDRDLNPEAGWKRVITYKWNGDKFVIDHVKDLPLDKAV